MLESGTETRNHFHKWVILCSHRLIAKQLFIQIKQTIKDLTIIIIIFTISVNKITRIIFKHIFFDEQNTLKIGFKNNKITKINKRNLTRLKIKFLKKTLCKAKGGSFVV